MEQPTSPRVTVVDAIRVSHFMPPKMYRYYESIATGWPEGIVSAVCCEDMPVSVHPSYIKAVNEANELMKGIYEAAAA